MAVHSSSIISTKSVVKSGVEMEKHSFTWIIENFDTVRKCNKLICGQKLTFKAGESLGLPTKWQFFLNCKSERKVRWIYIYFTLLDCSDENFPDDVEHIVISKGIHCKWADGRTYFKADDPIHAMHLGDPGTGWYGARIPADAMLKDLPLVDGSLILETEFVMYSPKPQTSVSFVRTQDITTQVTAFEARALQKLSQDLDHTEAVTTSNADSVTKIISVDKVEFPVNRGILSVRSPVFKRVFQSKMKEARSGVVYINDFSTKTLTVLLHYIMSGTLHQDWNSAEVIVELPYAAYEYELDLLVEFLDQVLGSVCTVGNAKQLAVLASQLGMNKAERDMLAFIKDKAAEATDFEDLTTLMDTTN